MIEDYLFWESLKILLSLLIVALLAPAIMGLAAAHDPSEAVDSAHSHQLPPPWPYHAIMVFAGSASLVGGAFTARYLKQRKGWIELHKKLALTVSHLF